MASSSCCSPNPAQKSDTEKDYYDGWNLAVQAWTFREFSFFETVDKTAGLGLKWIEMYPGQRLGDQQPGLDTNFNMSLETREIIKQKLADAGVKLRAYGVVSPGDQQQWRQLFEFCKDMGIATINSEPNPDQIDMIEELCKEFGIQLAIHNHPKPTRYWDPRKVLDLVEGRSELIGVCADVGHWMRSGIDPVAALQLLGDRVISLHMKDINKFGKPDAHDVIWSTGQSNFQEIIQHLHDHNFRGVISIEYEYNWSNSLPDVRQCIANYKKAVDKLEK